LVLTILRISSIDLQVMQISRFPDFWRRVQREGRDLLELVLLPGAAALLPWSAGFRMLRWLAQWSWLFRQQCAQALNAASAHGLVADPNTWAREHRLVMLVDHADLYLSRTRTDRWLRRHVDVHGDWGVAGQAALLVTFHWAAGMWAHRQARASGLHPHTLLARPDQGGYVGRWVLQRYGRTRVHATALADGRPIIFVPGSMQALRQALKEQEQIIVIIDVPPDQVNVTAPQRVLGRTVHMPITLPRLAVERDLPVTVFTLGFDLATGRRDLRLYPLGICDDAQVLSERIFQQFESVVRERPACWHFWSESARFFSHSERHSDSVKSDT
jgi:lauroyl/myristoyl acyltransferase